MSITAKPFTKWDLRRWFFTDPTLSTLERFVAIELLGCMDKKFRPVLKNLESQAILGGRVGAHRESINRALRKLRVAGYFSTTWKTVQRSTAQGIKGVTRVLIEVGPVVRHFVETGQHVSPDQARGVMSRHPSRALPASPGTVSSEGLANSTDRKGSRPISDAEDRRKTLGQWPRLAGGRPIDANQLPSAIPSSDPSIGIRDPDAYRAQLDEQDRKLAAKIAARSQGATP